MDEFWFFPKSIRDGFPKESLEIGGVDILEAILAKKWEWVAIPYPE